MRTGLRRSFKTECTCAGKTRKFTHSSRDLETNVRGDGSQTHRGRGHYLKANIFKTTHTRTSKRACVYTRGPVAVEAYAISPVHVIYLTKCTNTHTQKPASWTNACHPTKEALSSTGKFGGVCRFGFMSCVCARGERTVSPLSARFTVLARCAHR